jgi:cellulose synthase/poly-beta-1,6-N-acetylglucosamine synthase-like glycosyltransferase
MQILNIIKIDAFTDPVKYFLQLMKQRRRWINGSWFALNHGMIFIINFFIF